MVFAMFSACEVWIKMAIHQTSSDACNDVKKNSASWEPFHYITKQMRKLEGYRRQFVVTDDKLIAPLPIDSVILVCCC